MVLASVISPCVDQLERLVQRHAHALEELAVLAGMALRASSPCARNRSTRSLE